MITLAWRRSACRNNRVDSAVARLLAAAFLASESPLRNSGGNLRCFGLIQPRPPSIRSPLHHHQQPAYHRRLSLERSPYLLQHAHNPVDWYPWGKEAFDKAKSEDKPIFLSVGYSTCHWCHVMERESFEDEEIGKILSDNFVCIKVDREERPDVDKVYMTFVQATCGGGGWPMSVWLTPDLRPFIGGTYFPPTDHPQRPGLKTVLTRILQQWQNNRPALESNGEKILEALRKGTAVSANPGETPPSAPDVAQRCFQQLAHSYEEEYGGFRDAPKFPTPVNLMFLMSFWSVNRCSSEGGEALQMALHTLRMMALGGIHDHVAQGFHRYSTDISWHVPHFEKMLYDQAQLAVSGEQLFADVAKDILLYVSRDLSDKSGGFYSAEDADSVPASGGRRRRRGEVVEGSSGATQADVFMHHYGVKELGNVDPEQDPHGELGGQNVLIVRYSVELTAARFGLSVDRVSELLSAARAKMADVRKTRPRPHLDTKMLASWNAVLEDKALLERAVQAANFLKENLWDAERQTVLRSCYRGEDMELQQIIFTSILSSHSRPVLLHSPRQGGHHGNCLLDLYEASLQTQWLQWAEQLQLRQDVLFWDQQDGGYFCSDPNDTSILLQLKKDQDGAEPSANSVSASNLLRLSHYTGRHDWLLRSEQLLAAFSDRLQRVPVALPEMIVICGQREAPDTLSLLSAVHSLFLPHKVRQMLAEVIIYSNIPLFCVGGSSFTVTFDPQTLRVRTHPEVTAALRAAVSDHSSDFIVCSSVSEAVMSDGLNPARRPGGSVE
ncbi:Spermatogenesis-associated protein 20, partial [Dissostichus eleginoides]